MKQDCSNIEVFFKEFQRFRNSCIDRPSEKWYCDDLNPCDGCSFNKDICNIGVIKNLPNLISELQKWSDENPVKTRKEVFLESFPNAKKFGFNGLCAGDVFNLWCMRWSWWRYLRTMLE